MLNCHDFLATPLESYSISNSEDGAVARTLIPTDAILRGLHPSPDILASYVGYINFMIGSCLTPRNFFQILDASSTSQHFFYCSGVFSYKPIAPNSFYFKLNVCGWQSKKSCSWKQRRFTQQGQHTVGHVHSM